MRTLPRLVASLAAVPLLLVASISLATEPSSSGSGRVEASVVKVFSTVRRPDSFKPWTKEPAEEISGSGVIIEGKRILTNAHVVMYASQVQVQANQTGDKISAKVVAIAPGIDLALLKLDDEKVFDTHGALRRATDMPDVKDAVMAYGFPAGGSNLSITKGIVSRIEFAAYNRPVSGLRIQIDAAINHGNSGGPAVVGDQMIGLAFSSLGGTQNIGYIIPNEEIELFLADVADGKYDGKPALYEDLQTLENAALRVSEAAGHGAGHRRARSQHALGAEPAEDVGRHHEDRRRAHRRPGHGAGGREQPAHPLPVPRAAHREERQGPAHRRARRQDPDVASAGVAAVPDAHPRQGR
jgi:S1-C subfamily serine protease